jgi:hypothetical protein
VAGAVHLPYLLLWIPLAYWYHTYWHLTAPSPYLFLVSPAAIIVAKELGQASFPMTCVNFVIYGSLLFGIRRLCLRHADRLLGRTDSQTTVSIPLAAVALLDEKEIAPACQWGEPGCVPDLRVRRSAGGG